MNGHSTSGKILFRAIAARRSSLILRQFHLQPPLHRSGNVLARYVAQRPSTSHIFIPQVASEPYSATSREGAKPFETISTAPVGTSLQDVLPPDSQPRSKLATPLPPLRPMVMLEDVRPPSPVVPDIEREMRVEGILIPAKPVPPGEEGKSICFISPLTLYSSRLDSNI